MGGLSGQPDTNNTRFTKSMPNYMRYDQESSRIPSVNFLPIEIG